MAPPGYGERMVELFRGTPNIEYFGQVSPDEAVHIIGESALLLSTSDEEGLRNVRFAGLIAKSQIPTVADQHDIHLHTNRFENMPVSIIEMWACGLPIVGTNVGGMPYLVRNGLDAILVPSEDHQAMADACLNLLSDPDIAERLSLSGRRRAESLTWSRVKPMWEQVLFGEAGSRTAPLSPRESTPEPVVTDGAGFVADCPE